MHKFCRFPSSSSGTKLARFGIVFTLHQENLRSVQIEKLSFPRMLKLAQIAGTKRTHSLFYKKVFISNVVLG